MLAEGLSVGSIQDAQNPARDFGVPEVGMGLIGGH